LKKFSDYCRILKKEKISQSIFKFAFEAGDIAKSANPGQFIQVRTSADYVPLWPRPFSICDADPGSGELSIIFKILGCGTSQLADMQSGQNVHLLGPLGNGFRLLKDEPGVIMAAGGVGMPPLFFLARRSIQNGYPAERITFISGARSEDDLFKDIGLSELGIDLHVCTDDGSFGTRGTVVDLLEKRLKSSRDQIVYACGPMAMLEKIDRMLVAEDMSGFLSLEALMPCGYGICSGCAVRVIPSEDRGPTDDNREYHLQRVCVEGPVFESGEVIWQ
jgi:dihydroorotate dehydrogenase electron transfer subunit